MASAWGKSWGASWGNSWGNLDAAPAPAPAPVIAGGGYTGDFYAQPDAEITDEELIYAAAMCIALGALECR
jgi:hypothetical protein